MLALQEAIGADVIFVGVSVHDMGKRQVPQGMEQLEGGMSSAGIDQQAIDQVGGGPVAAFAQQGAGKVETCDSSIRGDPQHSLASLSLSITLRTLRCKTSRRFL